jgi:probable rRNA maturation factor
MSAATRVDLQRASDCERTPPADAIRRWARAALEAAGDGGSLCIRIVDEPESARLNATYRNTHTPTNVLSFPADLIDPRSGAPVLGDLAICAPLVAREADEQGKTLADHWAHLVVHGVLHLLGYDHQHEVEAVAMEGREIEILQGLGVANPYGD